MHMQNESLFPFTRLLCIPQNVIIELPSDCVSCLPPKEEMNCYRKCFNLIRVNHNDQVLFTQLTKEKNNI